MNGSLGGDGGSLDLLLLLASLNTKKAMMKQKKERKKGGFSSNGKCFRTDGAAMLPPMAKIKSEQNHQILCFSCFCISVTR